MFPTVRSSTVALALPALLALFVTGCGSLKGGGDTALHKALTLHASFDRGTDADLALGDPWIYQAPSLDKIREARPGLPPGGAVAVATSDGKFGGALRFGRKADPVVYYRGKDNVAWASPDWSGTVSFWLRADLGELADGFCDPLQLTSKAWNDAAFFVEFEKRPKEVPFRLGAYADYTVWNPRNLKWEDIAPADRPLVTVQGPPFGRDRWTHVAFTWERFNTGRADGMAVLYLDGAPIGVVRGRKQTYTWTPADVRLMLGVGYVGWIDDVAVFNRALTPDEVQAVRGLPRGIRSLFGP